MISYRYCIINIIYRLLYFPIVIAKIGIYRYGYKNKIAKNVRLSNNIILNNNSIARGCIISSYSQVSNSDIGKYTSIVRFSKISHTGIGKYCSISWDTTINAKSHPYHSISTSAFPYVPSLGNFVNKREQKYDMVVIKNDVWIGANSLIMPGVIIGNGAVIGASAVVTKDVPDYAIVAGVPAKIINYRFPKEVINNLLEIKWWDWEDTVIKQNIELFKGELTEWKLSKMLDISYHLKKD